MADTSVRCSTTFGNFLQSDSYQIDQRSLQQFMSMSSISMKRKIIREDARMTCPWLASGSWARFVERCALAASWTPHYFSPMVLPIKKGVDKTLMVQFRFSMIRIRDD
jgi:hypothetical protein